MKKKNRFCVVDSKRNKTANHDRSQTRTLFVWLLTAGNREREREGDCFFEASLVIYTVFQGNGVFSDDGNFWVSMCFLICTINQTSRKEKILEQGDGSRRETTPAPAHHHLAPKNGQTPHWFIPGMMPSNSFAQCFFYSSFSSHNINKSFRNGTGYINIWPVEAEARLRMHAESYAASPTD